MIPNRAHRDRYADYLTAQSMRARELVDRTNPSAGKIIKWLLIALLITVYFVFCFWLMYPAPVIDRQNNVTPADYQKVTYLSEKYKLRSYIWIIRPDGGVDYHRGEWRQVK